MSWKEKDRKTHSKASESGEEQNETKEREFSLLVYSNVHFFFLRHRMSSTMATMSKITKRAMKM